MRADIHGGPEHPLQSEAGYIDARPHSPVRGILLRRTAGPYIWVISGHFRAVGGTSANPPRAQVVSDLILGGLAFKKLGASLFLRMGGIQYLPPFCLLRIVRVAQSFCDDAFQIVEANSFEQRVTAAEEQLRFLTTAQRDKARSRSLPKTKQC